VAATVLHRQGDLGRVAEGMTADLVLVDGAPAERITDLARIRTVIKDGVVVHEAGEGTR
jgi:imidazolonepropionase-like amidohydrolase